MKKTQRDLVFQKEFLEDLKFWISQKRKVALKIVSIIEDIETNPFKGIGKPEPIKYLAPNLWSRRITQEHRLVYQVHQNRIDFLQCRYHYD